MSIYDLPPTCGAYAASSYDAGCRISTGGHCHREATRRVVAYDLATPQLYATYTEETCDEHAQPLADHWHRHGVRRPGKRHLYRVLARITDYQRSHIGTYPTQLLNALPDMPTHYELRHDRPPVTMSTVTLGPDYGRVDVDPSDSTRLGLVRREMVVMLATAYDCEAAAGLTTGGVTQHRLNLQIFGSRTHIRAFARALTWTINAAESECANALRGYNTWLRRRPDGDHDEKWRPSMRTAWRRHFLTAWMHRWTNHMYRAERGEPPLLAGAPRTDAEDYPAHHAAHRSADERWRDLALYHQDCVRHARQAAADQAADDRALGRDPTTSVISTPPDPGGTITAPGVTQPPPHTGPRTYGHRAPYIRPLNSQNVPDAHQLSLWPTPPGTVLPTPALPPRRHPEEPPGRPLLEILATHV
ncbi:hypothetical protein [Streptomyces alboflavus]|uniref:hypothetical protein n=1 Tax=Streptomyces alboflavus TaxID=67267 RepID=UPI000F658F5D|nr:hypothetical protein [Streptomyces alboflavus]